MANRTVKEVRTDEKGSFVILDNGDVLCGITEMSAPPRDPRDMPEVTLTLMVGLTMLGEANG